MRDFRDKYEKERNRNIGMGMVNVGRDEKRMEGKDEGKDVGELLDTNVS